MDILAVIYAQDYQKVKYKIDENGKFSAVKKRGSLTQLHNKVVAKLVEEGFVRTASAIKGKESTLINIATRYKTAITKSGAESLDGQYHAFFSCATENDRVICRNTLESLFSAFEYTTQSEPEFMDMGTK